MTIPPNFPDCNAELVFILGILLVEWLEVKCPDFVFLVTQLTWHLGTRINVCLKNIGSIQTIQISADCFVNILMRLVALLQMPNKFTATYQSKKIASNGSN